ncbi:AMP-binding enzyme, partial [Helicosporidium sp. ATCC 50920]
RAARGAAAVELARELHAGVHDYEDLLALDGEGRGLEEACAELLEAATEDAEAVEREPFHIYYTSGTTGRPKGVALSHRVVLWHALGCVREMRLCAEDVWGHFAPMFHLVDVFAVYAVTLVGGRHVTMPAFAAAPALLAIERERVSVVNFASTMVAMLATNPLAPLLDLTSLRLVSCGGSPASPAVVRAAVALFGCEFFVSYGMTETCGKIAMSILPQDLEALSPVQQLDWVCSSGRPFKLVDVAIVDDECGLIQVVQESGGAALAAPVSSRPGELLVRGPTVFEGYLNRPESRAESFTPQGWFRTGDLATVDARGLLRVVDRKKDMLLVGGENVYTTEVEAALYAHPAVAAAAVFGVANRVLGELVGAAVTLKEPRVSGQEAALARELVAWCRARLAEYKVPSVVHVLDAMPVTGSGKIL